MRSERTCGVVVIDTPGHDGYLMRLAHSLADTLVTPLNDSFVDLDVLGSVDPHRPTELAGSATIPRWCRGRAGGVGLTTRPTDWIVLRNRLSALGSRNKLSGGRRACKQLSRSGSTFAVSKGWRSG